MNSKRQTMPGRGRECVAFLGLGRMGAPMASALAARFDVRGWTRSHRTIAGLDQRVARAASPVEAARGASTIVLMLTDARASEEVLDSLAERLAPGTTVIDMATIGPHAARAHASKLAALGVKYLDAPVSGGVQGAAAGRLTIFVGGEEGAYLGVREVLSVCGTPHYLGPVGAGQTAKLANQIIVAGYIGAVAEGMRFAETQGMNVGQLPGILTGGFADSTILQQHGPRMASGDFTPGGMCRLHLKDLDLAHDLLRPEDPEFPLMDVVRERFRTLVASGRGEVDHSAYYLTYERRHA